MPFVAEASPFILGTTLRYHIDQQPEDFAETVEELRTNTYVDRLMKTGGQVEEMRKFKEETIYILDYAKFKVHKWESNIKELEDQNMPNTSKILGQVWDKEDDTLEIKIPPFSDDTPVTKKTILSHLGKVYDPLCILSPTMAQGKHIYREACDEKLGWNAVVFEKLAKAWLKWIAQLRSVKVPRSLVRQCNEVRSIDLHQLRPISLTASLSKVAEDFVVSDYSQTSLREDSCFKPVWYRIRLIHCIRSVKYDPRVAPSNRRKQHICACFPLRLSQSF